jgi:tRNA(Ile)-lysidine synthase TilS/MesJ
VEDSTNESDDYSRNLIRHRVMPVLKEINPEFSASVLRTSDILRADEEYLNAQARRFIDDNFAGGSLPADAMAALPESVAARVVRLMSGRAVSKERADAVLALLGSGEAALAELPGMRVLVERGRVTFGAAQPDNQPTCS